MHVGSDSDSDVESDARRGFTRLDHQSRRRALSAERRNKQAQSGRRIVDDEAKVLCIQGRRSGRRGM
jgi:hypothetical protein